MKCRFAIMATVLFLFMNPVALSAQSIVLNEFLADPPPAEAGDANRDGQRSSSGDEFLELVNTGEAPVNLAGWQVLDGTTVRHVFADTTSLDAGQALLLFGGGTPTGSFAGALALVASSGQLSLNNGGDQLILLDAAADTIWHVTYGGEAGQNQSLTRSPELTGGFVQHTNVNPELDYSAGTQADGAAFSPPRPQSPVILNEFYVDVAPGGEGDATGDGFRHPSEDEFIEFVNTSDSVLSLDGWSFSDGEQVRHVFPVNSQIPPRTALLLFGGGDANGAFGNATIQMASTGGMELDDAGDQLLLINPQGDTLIHIGYGSEAAQDQSMHRDPELTGNFAAHTGIDGAERALFSPGTRADRGLFDGTPPPNRPPVLVAIGEKSVAVGDTLHFQVHASDPDGDSLSYSAGNLPPGAAFSAQTLTWTPTEPGVFTDVLFAVEDGRGGRDEEIATLRATALESRLRISEIMAAPANQDCNGDGIADPDADQFIEIQNITGETLSLAGISLHVDDQERYRFGMQDSLSGFEAAVIFGGGTPAGYFGGAGRNGLVRTSSTGSLGLEGGSHVIELRSAAGDILASRELRVDSSTSSRTDESGEDAELQPHNEQPLAMGSRWSPGYRIDGSSFSGGQLFEAGHQRDVSDSAIAKLKDGTWRADINQYHVQAAVNNSGHIAWEAPIQIRIRILDADRNGVRLLNADASSQEEDGVWYHLYYNRFAGSDYQLSPGETSNSRELVFSNPMGQRFTVACQVTVLESRPGFELAQHGKGRQHRPKSALFHTLEMTSAVAALAESGKELGLSALSSESAAGPVQLRFQLPQSSRVVVRIFNVLGREVFSTPDRLLAAGEHRLRWSGLNKTGERVGNGLYFIRLTAGKQSIVRRLALRR